LTTDCDIQDPLYDLEVAARKRKSTWGGRRPGAGRKPTLKGAMAYTTQLEKADVDALKAIARKRGESVNSLIRAAVRAYVKRQRRR
jgi:hypothetical protein